MRRILITGTNRGIGLDLVQRYLQRDDTLIFATCRQPEQAIELQELAHQYSERLHILELHVTDPASIEALQKTIAARVEGLDMLVNNAGILPGGVSHMEPRSAKFGALDAEAMLEVLHVNTVAPVMLTQAFADLLRAGQQARVINMTSDAGSIARRQSEHSYSYVASKAALNMMTRCLAISLKAAEVIVISIHPGWIQTDMGGMETSLTLADTMPGLVKVIDGLTMADSGEFFRYDGERIPW